jgi:hypothetical protein
LHFEERERYQTDLPQTTSSTGHIFLMPKHAKLIFPEMSQSAQKRAPESSNEIF